MNHNTSKIVTRNVGSRTHPISQYSRIRVRELTAWSFILQYALLPQVTRSIKGGQSFVGVSHAAQELRMPKACSRKLLLEVDSGFERVHDLRDERALLAVSIDGAKFGAVLTLTASVVVSPEMGMAKREDMLAGVGEQEGCSW